MCLEVMVLLFVYFFIVFIIGQLLKDNSIVDMAWGSGFVIAALYTYFTGQTGNLKATLITVAIILWGTRLTYHISKRNIGKPEDYRYVQMRERWGTEFPRIKAFFNVYFLQFAIMYVVSLPVIFGNSTSQQNLMWWNYIGIAFWFLGYFFEVVGDYQLKKFKLDPKNKGVLFDQGLWAYTRHPNYFGDASMWTGIFLIALSGWSSIWIIVGPALMTFFIVFVSGVSMLEKKYVGRADYDAYKKRTNSFIPGPRKDKA